jgi:molybdenum cofactor biosynthesis enzyme MoaA
MPTDEDLVRIGEGCSAGCRFCPHSGGHAGARLAEVLGPSFKVPSAHRVTILAGDLIREDLAPLVQRIRQAGASRVLVYGHPAVRDPLPALQVLHRAGLTGVHLLLPAGSRELMAALTGGRGSLARTAALMDAANHLDLSVMLEIPVVQSSWRELADTVRRGLNRIARPDRIVLRYLSEFDPVRGPVPWDHSLSAAAVAEARMAASARAVPMLLGHPEAPPPCVLDVAGATPDLYPSFTTAGYRPDRSHPYDACATCHVAPVCAADGRFLATAPGSVRPIAAESPVPVSGQGTGNTGAVEATSSVTLFRRQTELGALLTEFRSRPRICRFPWEELEAHDIRGTVTPCAGGWPLDATVKKCTSWRVTSLLDAWNSRGMQDVRRAVAGGTPFDTCKADCPAFHGGPQSSVPSRLAGATRTFHQNVVLNLREMLDGAEVLKSRPQTISISPTLRCPHRCRMCDIHEVRDVMGNGPELNEMPDALFDELLELLPTTRVLALTGGEPLASRRLMDLFRRFRADAYPDGSITLTTNGLLLTKPVVAALAPTPLRAVYVSLNAATPETHAFVSGRQGGFHRVVANIEHLAGVVRDMAGHPSIILSFVVMQSNRSELADFLDLALRLGAGIRLLPIERDRLGESIFTDEASIRATLEDIRTRIVPRQSAFPWGYRHEVARLVSILEGRIARREFGPL